MHRQTATLREPKNPAVKILRACKETELNVAACGGICFIVGPLPVSLLASNANLGSFTNNSILNFSVLLFRITLMIALSLVVSIIYVWDKDLRHKNMLLKAKLNFLSLKLPHYPVTFGEIASVVKVLQHDRGNLKERHSIYVFFINGLLFCEFLMWWPSHWQWILMSCLI